MENNEVKVNEIAKQLLFELHLTAAEMGRTIGLSSDASYKLLKRSDWKISEMKAVGDYVDTNFFELFVPQKVNAAELSEKLKAKEEELNAMKHKMEVMEIENKYLKELVEMAKMKLKK